jgi:hypothetical protein
MSYIRCLFLATRNPWTENWSHPLWGQRGHELSTLATDLVTTHAGNVDMDRLSWLLTRAT